MSTAYHAKYFANELSRHHNAGSVQKLTHSLFDACIDLNPHQIEAALFALRSPLSRGAILADEVGLGKTIEAGLLLCQYWAERKRKLLIICPAALRKQWSIELQEKFMLPNVVIDARNYNQLVHSGQSNPFAANLIIITSINFASRYSVKIRTIDWDLVIIDEAHKLRNVFRAKNKMAQNIKWALEDRKKVLLTATPLQNSLLELYGLASLIDEHIFGDLEAFRSQYINRDDGFADLEARLGQICKRTLRNQVTEYIRYTKRRTLTVPYSTSDVEQELYERISEFISREDTYSIPHGQRHLMTLVLRKILASSTYAIYGTLDIMRNRLKALEAGETVANDMVLDTIFQVEEIEDEYLEEEGPEDNGENGTGEIDPKKLKAEIRVLNDLIKLAKSIPIDTKAETLLTAIETGFGEMEKMNAPRKAIIFTESRRTQEYLVDLLSHHGYKNKLILFNGSNNDKLSNDVYEQWVAENRDSGRVSGSRAVDMRTAIVEYFRNHAEIMIATEAAAEGINLQFCSLLINYDLPWNPQRIEQRIGRCHRYGQKFDVVVVNFLNQRNETDCRVYELLEEKFNLFEDVFGASDEVLGNIESGVDFEKRILDIYQKCRTNAEIEAAFNSLRQELDITIQDKMAHTRQTLLDHFDQDVHARFKTQLENAREQLDRYGVYFWELSKYILEQNARFDDAALKIDLLQSPMPVIKTGQYRLVSKNKENNPGEFLYRLSHPLGEYVLSAGKYAETRSAHLYFDISNHPVKLSVIRALKGKSGWMTVQLLKIVSFEPEEYIIFTAYSDDRKLLDQETCEKFFACRAAVANVIETPPEVQRNLDRFSRDQVQEQLEKSRQLNNTFFIEECDKLDKWADDMVIGVEKELQQNKARLKALNREARITRDTVGQHQLQVQIKNLEYEKRSIRKKLFDVEDEIMLKRDAFIEKLQQRMNNEHKVETLFTIRWSVV